jgi:uncharacterized lipoprotein YajG
MFKSLLAGILFLVACSAQKPPEKIVVPTNAKQACVETVLAFCVKSDSCKLMSLSDCIDTSLQLCVVTTGIRDVKVLYNNCLPWINSSTCEEFKLAGQYPTCKGQILLN